MHSNRQNCRRQQAGRRSARQERTTQQVTATPPVPSSCSREVSGRLPDFIWGRGGPSAPKFRVFVLAEKILRFCAYVIISTKAASTLGDR